MMRTKVSHVSFECQYLSKLSDVLNSRLIHSLLLKFLQQLLKMGLLQGQLLRGRQKQRRLVTTSKPVSSVKGFSQVTHS